MDNLNKLIQDRIDELAKDSLSQHAAARPRPGQRIYIENHDCRSIFRGAPVAYEVQLDYTNSYPTSIKAKYGSWR